MLGWIKPFLINILKQYQLLTTDLSQFRGFLIAVYTHTKYRVLHDRVGIRARTFWAKKSPFHETSTSQEIAEYQSATQNPEGKTSVINIFSKKNLVFLVWAKMRNLSSRLRYLVVQKFLVLRNVFGMRFRWDLPRCPIPNSFGMSAAGVLYWDHVTGYGLNT